MMTETEVNDSTRALKIHDKASKTIKETSLTKLADPKNKLEIGASIPGTIIKVLVEPGQKVKENQLVAIIEAMKMETQVLSPVNGSVKSIFVKEGQKVESGELLIMLK